MGHDRDTGLRGRFGQNFNHLDNSGFQIWSSGAIIGGLSNGDDIADRWTVNIIPGDGIAAAEKIDNDNDFAGFGCSLHYTTLGAGGNHELGVRQTIPNPMQFNGEPVNIQFHAKTTFDEIHILVRMHWGGEALQTVIDQVEPVAGHLGNFYTFNAHFPTRVAEPITPAGEVIITINGRSASAATSDWIRIGDTKFEIDNQPTPFYMEPEAIDNVRTGNSAAGSIGTFLELAGGTMTGALTLAGSPTANNHAATKNYVDTEVGLIAGMGPFLPLTGGVLRTNLVGNDTLKIEELTGQNRKLLNLLDASANELYTFDSTEAIFNRSLTLRTNDPAKGAVLIRGAAGQTADILKVQDASANPILDIKADSSVVIANGLQANNIGGTTGAITGILTVGDGAAPDDALNIRTGDLRYDLKGAASGSYLPVTGGILKAAATGDNTLVIEGIPGQTGSLLNIYPGGATSLLNATMNDITIRQQEINSIPLSIHRMTGGNADLFAVYDSDTSEVLALRASGDFLTRGTINIQGAGQSTIVGTLAVGNATAPGQALNLQTADLRYAQLPLPPSTINDVFFADLGSPPAAPTLNDLWYRNDEHTLALFNTSWREVFAPIAFAASAATPTGGKNRLWYVTDDQNIRVHDGTAWRTVYGAADLRRSEQTASAGQSTFNTAFDVVNERVYLNGGLLTTSEYSTGPNQVTLNTPASAGDRVVISSAKAPPTFSPDDYVKKSGDTMAGELDMGGHRVPRVGAATAGTDALNRDVGDGRYALINGNAANRFAVNAPAGVGTDDDKAIPRSYADGRYAAIGGDPARHFSVATAGGTGVDAINRDAGDARFLRVDGNNTMTGILNMLNHRISNLADATGNNDALRLGQSKNLFYQKTEWQIQNTGGAKGKYILRLPNNTAVQWGFFTGDVATSIPVTFHTPFANANYGIALQIELSFFSATGVLVVSARTAAGFSAGITGTGVGSFNYIAVGQI